MRRKRPAPSAPRSAISGSRADGSRQLQVGYVGAGDQQHGCDASEQDQERLAVVAGEITLQRLGENPAAFSPVCEKRAG